MRRRGVVAVAALLTLAACGGSSDEAAEPAATTAKAAASATTVANATTAAGAATTAKPAAAAEAILGASNNVFSPVKAAPGQKVRIASGDPVPHTAISNDNAWTFDEKSSGFTAPAKAGTYSFFCGVHGKGMSGTLTVV